MSWLNKLSSKHMPEFSPALAVGERPQLGSLWDQSAGKDKNPERRVLHQSTCPIQKRNHYWKLPSIQTRFTELDRMSENVGNSQPLLTTYQLSLTTDPFFLVSNYAPEVAMQHSPRTVNKKYLPTLAVYLQSDHPGRYIMFIINIRSRADSGSWPVVTAVIQSLAVYKEVLELCCYHLTSAKPRKYLANYVCMN